MFQTAAGVTVPFPEKLSEQYELDGNTITANLSFEKLSDFVGGATVPRHPSGCGKR